MIEKIQIMNPISNNAFRISAALTAGDGASSERTTFASSLIGGDQLLGSGTIVGPPGLLAVVT